MITLNLQDKPPKETLLIRAEQDPRQVIYREAVAKGFKGTFEEFYQQIGTDKFNVLSQVDW